MAGKELAATQPPEKTALLAFTINIPDEHYLGILSVKAAQVAPAFADLLRPADDFQREAFTLLEYAYIGARYDRRYAIDEPSVLLLADRVAELLRLTGEKCREKIAAHEKAAGVWLPNGPKLRHLSTVVQSQCPDKK